MGKASKRSLAAVAMGWDPKAKNDEGTKGSFTAEFRETLPHNRHFAEIMFAIGCARKGRPDWSAHSCFNCETPVQFPDLPGHTYVCRPCWESI